MMTKRRISAIDFVELGVLEGIRTAPNGWPRGWTHSSLMTWTS
jgi:hypothetical protein